MRRSLLSLLLAWVVLSGSAIAQDSRPSNPAVREISTKGKHRFYDMSRDWDWWWKMNGGSFLSKRLAAAKEAGDPVDDIECWLPCRPEDATRKSLARVNKYKIRREVLPILRVALNDPFHLARARSALSLGKVVDKEDQDLEGIVRELRALLSDPAKEAQESACLALGLVGDKSQVPDLILIMKDDPKGREIVWRADRAIPRRLRAFAALAIGLIGSQDPLDDTVIAELIAMAGTRPPAAQPAPASRPESRPR